jgi:ubiquinone/menaquinone biosynthesis C-methylase UbiE
MGREEHWDDVYTRKARDEVSWYRAHLERSVAWIEEYAPGPDAHVVDMGGGASTLVDDLLERGFGRVTVADLSAVALEATRGRLGERAQRVRWVVGDATAPLLEDASVDVWHDRAVFHFLTEPERRRAYVEQVRRCVRPGGHVIVATFAADGPERCSGLPVARYDAHELADAFGEGFSRVEDAREVHTTPWGSPQAFTWVVLRVV